DYPKPGIIFRDITSLIEDSEGFRESCERLAEAHRSKGITKVAGIEARGFIFGAGVAIALGVGSIPVRKAGKLPGETPGHTSALQYGVHTIEIHANAAGLEDNVLLVDDLTAPGGTAIAAVSLLRRTGARVQHAAFVIDLPDIGGADRLRGVGVEVEALIALEGQ